MKGYVVATLALAVLYSSGCKKGSATSTSAAPSQPTAEVPTSLKPSASGLSGVVKEVKEAGGYTYLRLDVEGKEEWAAVSKVQVKVGEQVTVAGAMPMHDFESKALERKFAKIYFGVVQGKGEAAAQAQGDLPNGHPPIPSKAPHGLPQSEPQLDKPLPRAPEGKTVAEIHAERTALAGKTVAVRGKVVKYTPGVMGKNWIHLQDGTGAATKGDFDLTLTTKDTAKLGDIVVARGKVGTDKNFGAGYRYGVILEDAKLVGP